MSSVSLEAGGYKQASSHTPSLTVHTELCEDTDWVVRAEQQAVSPSLPQIRRGESLLSGHHVKQYSKHYKFAKLVPQYPSLPFLFFKIESHYVDLAGFQLTEISLPQPPKCWD